MNSAKLGASARLGAAACVQTSACLRGSAKLGASARLLVSASVLAWCGCGPPAAVAREPAGRLDGVRIAMFNASLFRDEPGRLARDLAVGSDQARKVAEIVARIGPDILLLAEFDRDPIALARFRSDYLAPALARHHAPALTHALSPPCNTGVDSGFDLDRDGSLHGPADAWGYGAFAGQYCFAILARWPILRDRVRTFAALPWMKMPGHRMPQEFWPDEVARVLPLSSKNHVDVPIAVDGQVLHVLAHHPTPPTFDGPEDRNGRRNHDEIRLWADYLDPDRSGWIVDDAGVVGGLAHEARFVVVGDHNADPLDGDSLDHGMNQLLEHPRVAGLVAPASLGAVQAARAQGGANRTHRGDPALDTADFPDDGPGNLRVDYVLPARGLVVKGAKVFWPVAEAAEAQLLDASDHRALWVDLAWAPE